jgi:hypothetical protein
MNRQRFAQTLESLSRPELRALASELCAWVGESALSVLYPDGPIRGTTRQAQLALAVVDVEASAARREHVLSLSLGVLRAGPALGGAVPNLDSLRDGIAGSWRSLESDAASALRFDFPAGLELASALVRAVVQLRVAMDAYQAEVPLPSLDGVLGLLAERAASVSLDERTFGSLVSLCADASRTGSGDAWASVAALIASQPDARRWLIRLFESNQVRRSAVVPLLDVLAGADGAVEDVVQVGEICLDAGVEVFGVMVRALHGASRIQEARFWIGEGRLRHPSSDVWADLEASLF